jgi:hypothetical protein
VDFREDNPVGRHAFCIHQMHEPVAVLQPIESDASPSRQVILANLII